MGPGISGSSPLRRSSTTQPADGDWAPPGGSDSPGTDARAARRVSAARAFPFLSKRDRPVLPTS